VAAREISSALEIRYVHALRLLRLARVDKPRLRGVELRNACQTLLDKERDRG